MVPFTPGVSAVEEIGPGETGFVFTFEAGTCGSGPTSSFGSFRIGEIQFQINDTVASGGVDVQAGFFNAGADGAFSNPGLPLAMTFGSASIDKIPEPATLGLVALGLVFWGLWSRYRGGRAVHASSTGRAHPH